MQLRQFLLTDVPEKFQRLRESIRSAQGCKSNHEVIKCLLDLLKKRQNEYLMSCKWFWNHETSTGISYKQLTNANIRLLPNEDYTPLRTSELGFAAHSLLRQNSEDPTRTEKYHDERREGATNSTTTRTGKAE